MKTPLMYIFCFTLLISNPINLLGQDTFERYDSKEELESDVKKIIRDFDLFMKDKGIEPPYIPTVNIQTGPFLIKWDEPNKGIILPFWDELLDEQKEIFKAWKGENAEEFFISLFNWLFVPHELGHFMNPMEDSLTPYKKEQAANEFAIAFFLSQKENQEKMDYTQLSRNPNAYGYFQFKFILNSLHNREDIDILYYFGR